jgi:hypothetical protein
MLTQVDDEGREFAVASISYYIPMLNKNPWAFMKGNALLQYGLYFILKIIYIAKFSPLL